MKNKFIVVTVLIIIVSICGCFIYNSVQNKSIINYPEYTKTANLNNEENYEYILKPVMCRQFFGCETYDIDEILTTSDIINGHYVSRELMSNNCVKILLSQNDIDYWRSAAERQINHIIEQEQGYNYSVIVDDNYTVMRVNVSKSTYREAALDVFKILPYCGIMQMLNSNASDDWNVYIEFIRNDTGDVIENTNYPRDGGFTINDSDW